MAAETKHSKLWSENCRQICLFSVDCRLLHCNEYTEIPSAGDGVDDTHLPSRGILVGNQTTLIIWLLQCQFTCHAT